ncbi:MAG: carbohydrate kinase family protein [Bacteroidota bacterium]
MKILLIGHSIIDHFEEVGNKIPKPGGVFYSSLGILSVSNACDGIFLLTSWNENSFYLFEKVYSKVDLRFAVKVDAMPEVFLKTSGEKEREEIYKNLSTQLSIKQINNWNQFDGILINMITGFDISLEQLKTIRKKFSGIIYFDFHTLSRGIEKNMKREFRPIPNAKEWLENIDIIQCNRSELDTIIKEGSEVERANQILQAGPKILIITKGEKGAQIYFNYRNKINSFSAAAERVNAVNKVGCGDIFGAVFFYSYISTKDVYKSLKTAIKAGAVAASKSNLTTQPDFRLND